VTRQKFGFGTLAGALLLSAAAVAPAHAASELFTLSAVDSAAGLGSGPFGTVLVTEDAGALDFVETLAAGFKFHENPDPNHSAFAFSLAGDPAITISDLTGGFTQKVGANFSASPFGSYDYALKCSGCGHGYGHGLAGPLSFTVSGPGLTIASLLSNLKDSQHIFFTTDVVNGNGKTGNVGATGSGPVGGAVPEPAAWALMIVGLGGIGASLRRRREAPALS
jgi:hypothetical protein